MGDQQQDTDEAAVRLATAVLSGANRELFQRYEVEVGKSRQLALKVASQEETLKAFAQRAQVAADEQLEVVNKLYGDLSSKKQDMASLDKEEEDLNRQIEELGETVHQLSSAVGDTKHQLNHNFELPGLKHSHTLGPEGSPTRTGERFLEINAHDVFSEIPTIATETAKLLDLDPKTTVSTLADACIQDRPHLKGAMVVIENSAKSLVKAEEKLLGQYDRGILFMYEYEAEKQELGQIREILQQEFLQVVHQADGGNRRSSRARSGSVDSSTSVGDLESAIGGSGSFVRAPSAAIAPSPGPSSIFGSTSIPNNTASSGSGSRPRTASISLPRGHSQHQQPNSANIPSKPARPMSGNKGLDNVRSMVDRYKAEIESQQLRLSLPKKEAMQLDDVDFEINRRAEQKEVVELREEERKQNATSTRSPSHRSPTAKQQQQQQQLRQYESKTTDTKHQLLHPTAPLKTSDAFLHPRVVHKNKYRLAAARALGGGGLAQKHPSSNPRLVFQPYDLSTQVSTTSPPPQQQQRHHGSFENEKLLSVEVGGREDSWSRAMGPILDDFADPTTSASPPNDSPRECQHRSPGEQLRTLSTNTTMIGNNVRGDDKQQRDTTTTARIHPLVTENPKYRFRTHRTLETAVRLGSARSVASTTASSTPKKILAGE